MDKGTQTDEEDARGANNSPLKRSGLPLSPIRKETEHVPESSDDDEKVNDLQSPNQEPSEFGTAVPLVARARMVTVPKRVPPTLPPRNPNRRSSRGENERDGDGFDAVSLNGSEHSDATLEQRKSDAGPEYSTDKTQIPLTEDNFPTDLNGAPRTAGDDDFHSAPPSPGKEPSSRGIPGAF